MLSKEWTKRILPWQCRSPTCLKLNIKISLKLIQEIIEDKLTFQESWQLCK